MDYEKTTTGAPKKRTFCGLGWQQGDYLNIALKKEDIDKIPLNDKGYIRITVKAHATPNEKTGATHMVWVDEYSSAKKKEEF